MKTEQIINSRQSLEAYKKFLDAQFERHKYLRMTAIPGKTRSLTQNRCLHLFCAQLADVLNDGGFDFRETLKAGYAVPWDEYLVKNHIWRPIQKAMTGKESTTKPTKKEYTEIYEVVNARFMADRSLYIPWPSKQELERE